MKTIKDLKIGDIIWKVDSYADITEDIIEELTKNKIITSINNYPVKDRLVDRLTNQYNSTLCTTYLDAVDLATTICLAKIKEHTDEVTKRLSAIQAVGSRIHELNDIKQNNTEIPIM